MPGVTRCRNAAIDAEAELPTDALAAWRARGWEPITDSRTLEVAEAERVTAENEAAEAAADVVEAMAADKRLTVEQVLEQVGDDPALAAAALQVEQSHENPRTTLVARLNQITNPAGDAGTDKEN